MVSGKTVLQYKSESTYLCAVLGVKCAFSFNTVFKCSPDKLEFC